MDSSLCMFYRMSGAEPGNRKDYPVREELGRVAVVLDKVAHCGRRDVCEFLGGRDDNSLDFRSEPPVHVGNRPFSLEIEHIPYSTDYMPYTQLAASIDSKIIVFNDLDSGQSPDSLGDNFHPLVHCKETRLVLIDTHGHDDLVEHGERPFENVKVPRGKGIERTREQCCFFHYDLD